MNSVYLLTGSNSGDRKALLAEAVLRIGREVGRVEKRSSLYETEAWGKTDQPPFLNQALLVLTELTAREVLGRVLRIEREMGRTRSIKWEQRTIDIDLLFFDEEVVSEPGLHVPHPFVHERRFALIPMAEIAPFLLHPVLQKRITELLETCGDKLEVKKYHEV
jgi:2-amino-4-hydroxy-6-hydroxymethyldihydropteridine diphosphokinase